MSINQQREWHTIDASSKKDSAQDIYQQVASDSLLVEDVFSAISDNKSLSLFNFIGIASSSPTSDVGHPNGEILISRLNLTRKQYYTRINQLRNAGLISKKRAVCSYFTWEGSLRNPQNNRHCNSKSMETSSN